MGASYSNVVVPTRRYIQERGIAKESRISICSSWQKEILDKVDSRIFRKSFLKIFNILQRSKVLERYVYYNRSYLILLDGSSYYNSKKVKCRKCLIRKEKEKINYQHHVLQMFMVHPKEEVIIPLMPEEISNKDGKEKQDCEVNAAKRGLRLLRKDHPKLRITIVGDCLYSKQPMIEEIEKLGMHYIFVVKPSNHRSVYEDIEGLRRIGGVKSCVVELNGHRDFYEWANNVQLNGKKDTKLVNYFSYVCTNGKEEVYKNSWITDYFVTSTNVKLLAKGGRSRWKCENEGFNNLKNRGYHIEHNYGHGKENLCFNNYVLNVLSFLIHMVCELKYELFRNCNNKLGKKSLIWQKVRDYVEVIVFDDWDGVFKFIYSGGGILVAIPPPDLGVRRKVIG